MPNYQIIVVPTDLSDPALSAVHHAGALARRLGSRLLLTYVVEDRLPPIVPGLTGDPSVQRLVERHVEHAGLALAECAAENLAGLGVETVVRVGTVHDEIVKLATERRADLIVIGMHGHGFLTHALAGSTAERVLHHAPCPVLVVAHSHG